MEAFHRLPELLRPGITVFLADPDDPNMPGEEIARMLEDEAGLESMGRNCRRIVLQESTLELQVQRYTGLYRGVMGGNR